MTSTTVLRDWTVHAGSGGVIHDVYLHTCMVVVIGLYSQCLDLASIILIKWLHNGIRMFAGVIDWVLGML